MANNGEFRGTFTLVSGRHHGPEVWPYVEQELHAAGWQTVVPNLPIEDDTFDLNQHAKIVAQAEHRAGARNIQRLAWSWAANVTPRLTYLTDVKGLIYLAGAFHPATLRDTPKPQHSLVYEAMESNPSPESFAQMAEYAFYHDIDDDVLKALIIGSLRKHRRRQYEPQLTEYPWHLPSTYIALRNDKALVFESQLEIAKSIGVAEPKTMDAGHAPMLSREKSKELAAILINFASRNGSN